MKYSNPRQEARFNDWPSGRYRVECEFAIEAGPRGERATRRTRNPKTGQWCKLKADTYAPRVRIVDGEDGRTYILKDTMTHLSVMESNLQYQAAARRCAVRWNQPPNETGEEYGPLH